MLFKTQTKTFTFKNIQVIMEKKKRMAFFSRNFHKNIFSQSIIFWQMSGKYCHLTINQASFKITNLHLGFVSSCHQPTSLPLAIKPGQFLSC